MLEFIETKVMADVQKKVGEADQWLATMMLRKPEIALPAAKKARALLKAAFDSAHHADPTFVMDTLALSRGPSADDAVDDRGEPTED